MDDLFYQLPDELKKASEQEIERANEYMDLGKLKEDFRGEKRLPVEFILDTSGSMRNNGKIDALNNGINHFIEKLRSEFKTKVTVDVGIITMGGISPQVVAPLETIDHFNLNQIYEANGYTLVGEALRMAVSEITSRKIFYYSNNIEYYRPLIILLSDGYPSDHQGHPIQDPEIIQEYVDFVKEKTDAKSAIFYTFYIGEDSGARETMKKLASTWENTTYAYALKDDSEKIEQLFVFLSNSINTGMAQATRQIDIIDLR